MDQKVLSLFTKTGSAYTWEDYAYREGVVLGAAYSNATTYHFDVDHLGNVRLETPGSTNQTTYYRDLWPYGDEATPPSSPERMRFAGQERDLGTLTSIADDIDYMHARYYRPIFGRFLSADPAAGSAMQPHGWNRYSYAAGNPLRITDPSGRYLCSDKALCTLFEEARQANLQDPATQAAAAAYGLPEIDNGVQVKFGATGSQAPGDTQGGTEANAQGTAMVAKVTVTLEPQLKGVDLEAMVAHEGTHVAQWQAWAASWDVSKPTYDLSKNLRVYESEQQAYRVENAVYARHQMSGKVFGCKGCTLGIVNKTVGDVDKAIRLILREPGEYHTFPDDPTRLDPKWTTALPPP